MMAGALIYLLGNEVSTVEVHYKSVGGFYPEILQLAANFKDGGRRRGKRIVRTTSSTTSWSPFPKGEGKVRQIAFTTSQIES